MTLRWIVTNARQLVCGWYWSLARVSASPQRRIECSVSSPLATAGGLVFHSGTEDSILRAHDVDTGEIVASFPLPASAHAGPITYRSRPGGRQLLVVAAGGHHNVGRMNQSSQLGDWIIAYAVPSEAR